MEEEKATTPAAGKQEEAGGSTSSSSPTSANNTDNNRTQENGCSQEDETREDAQRDGGDAEGDHDEIVIEQPLLTIKEVFVYRVPPLRASSGHRAEEWGLASPVFSGVLKAAQVGSTCCLRIYKPPPEGELGATPELFAECAVRLDNGRTLQVYVESVIDSSRYFVLRCEDKASGRHAYVGIGFRERSSAFDLKAVLDDFARFLDRQKKAEETTSIQDLENEGDHPGPVKQMKDLSIAEGEKLHLGLKVASGGGSRARRRVRKDASKVGEGGLLLAPPPLPGTTYSGAAASTKAPGSPSAASPPPPPLSPRPDASETVSPPTVTSPARGSAPVASLPPDVEPPDATSSDGTEETTDLAGVEGGSPDDSDSKLADDVDSGNDDDNDDGNDGDDGDGWGEFESA